MDIAETVPNAITSGQKPNKGSILRLALDYIKVRENKGHST